MDNYWILEKIREEERDRERKQEQPTVQFPLYNPEDYCESTPEAAKEERGVVEIDL